MYLVDSCSFLVDSFFKKMRFKEAQHRQIEKFRSFDITYKTRRTKTNLHPHSKPTPYFLNLYK